MKLILTIACLLLAPLTQASTSGITFIHQPLTTLGTDADSAIIMARLPVIASGPLEAVFMYISKPNKLIQRENGDVEDSNLLSNLAIEVSCEWIDKPDHHVVTLDLTKMKSPEDHDLTDEAVVKAAIDCIRKTIDEHGKGNKWKIKITPKAEDAKKWTKFEGDYPAKRRK